MTQTRRLFACAVLAMASLALTACSGEHAIVPAANSYSNGFARQTFGDDLLAGIPNVAGTYNGTFVETANGHSYSGTVTVVMQQSGSKVSGTVTEHILGHTNVFSMSGTVAKTAKGASVKFTIFGKNGRNASAHGNVIGKHFNGKAYIPPSGNSPAVHITFKTVKA